MSSRKKDSRDTDADARDERLSQAIDAVTATFGPGAILFGIQGDGRIRSSHEQQSPHYTTRWSEIPKVSVK